MNIYKFSPSPKTKANAISAIEWQDIFSWWKWPPMRVVICWKIRIFAYWTTPQGAAVAKTRALWFAEKFVSLLIEQHLCSENQLLYYCCDLLKNSYLCLLNNTIRVETKEQIALWFAEKFVSLLIEQHPAVPGFSARLRCDLLKNSYLCLLNNTHKRRQVREDRVVICWKIRIFAYWTTPTKQNTMLMSMLWFAEKFVSLLIEQHLNTLGKGSSFSCDLLKNSYLCLLNNT